MQAKKKKNNKRIYFLQWAGGNTAKHAVVWLCSGEKPAPERHWMIRAECAHALPNNLMRSSRCICVGLSSVEEKRAVNDTKSVNWVKMIKYWLLRHACITIRIPSHSKGGSVTSRLLVGCTRLFVVMKLFITSRNCGKTNKVRFGGKNPWGITSCTAWVYKSK